MVGIDVGLGGRTSVEIHTRWSESMLGGRTSVEIHTRWSESMLAWEGGRVWRFLLE